MDGLPDIDLCQVSAETASVEFKSSFDPKSKQDWSEIIKDIVAMANSGGGVIVFGVNDQCAPVDCDIDSIVQIDPADLTNKVYGFTNQHFSNFLLQKRSKDGKGVAVLQIGGNRIPFVFTSSGVYVFPNPSGKTAFAKGTVYFRHGAKSEPGTTEDIRSAIERELTRTKEFLLEGISKVVAAPSGTVVQIVQSEVTLKESPQSAPIRFTNDDAAPAFRAIKQDEIYPYRQKELILAINTSIGRKIVSQYDIQAIRFIYKMYEDPNYTCKSKWAPWQYSEMCLQWILDAYSKNNDFFAATRAEFTARLRGDSSGQNGR